MFFKFGEGRGEEAGGQFDTESHGNGAVEEITSLKHLASQEQDGFKPVMLLDLNRGSVVACAVSDAGG